MRINDVYLSDLLIREVRFALGDELAAVFLSLHPKAWCLSRWPARPATSPTHCRARLRP